VEGQLATPGFRRLDLSHCESAMSTLPRQSPQGLEYQILKIALGSPDQGVPVNLMEIAQRLGVRDVLTGSYIDGYSDWSGGTPIIRLSARQPENRRRFTLGHELAHVMVRSYAVRNYLLARSWAIDEERLCNRISAALLLPHHWMLTNRAHKATLEELFKLADAAGVSIATMIIRLNSVNWPCSLFRWAGDDHDNLRLAESWGVPRSWRQAYRLTSRSLNQIRRRGDHFQVARVRLTATGAPAVLLGVSDIRYRGRDIVVLARYRWPTAAEEQARHT
jgi:hypothetical protein